MIHEVIITSDDSPSVYSNKFEALYHSKHGAIQESEHVFINAGLKTFLDISSYRERPNKSISILEIGFGTGLNAYLSMIYAQSHGLHLDYTGLEGYPLESSTISAFSQKLDTPDEYSAIHAAEWNKKVILNSHFDLTKNHVLFENFVATCTYDIIYFDAFAPNTQPELWEVDMMKKMHICSHIGSILVTYCAKGQVRRNMQEAGFQVERIPGPPGKREMLRAVRMN